MIHRTSLATCLGLLLVLPGGASGAIVSSPNVLSPSKKIFCFAVTGRSGEIECIADYLPNLGYLDTYMALRPTGRAFLAERGDFPGYTSPRVTLRYGDTWRRRGIRCTMRRTGLTCRNRSGHGFHLAAGDVRRF